MQQIPDWIAKIVGIGKMRCNDCNMSFKVDDMISVGIQESNQAPHPDMMCIGMFCKKCREITIFELKEMSVIDFAFEVLDRESDSSSSNQRKRVVRKKREIPKSKISAKEIKKDVEFLKKVKTHEEFLVALGMSPTEIEKYNIKKTKHEK